MQAVILAGGKGTRLLPYTTVLPKPLMPIGEKPVLEIVLGQLKHAGFRKIIIAVGYLESLIQAYFGDGRRFGLDITYSIEGKPLGTAGPLGLLDHLEENFLVMNGDVLANLDLSKLYRKHLRSKAICTVSVFSKSVPITLGVLDVSPKGLVTKYTEKPTLKYDVSMGIYIFNRRIQDFIPRNKHLDLPELITTLIRKKETVQTFAFRGEWLDIGRPEDYEVAQREAHKFV